MSESKNEYEFIEYESKEVAGFLVADSQSKGLRPHNDVIWLGYGGVNGRWMTPDELLELAEAIKTVVASHIERHKTE